MFIWNGHQADHDVVARGVEARDAVVHDGEVCDAVVEGYGDLGKKKYLWMISGPISLTVIIFWIQSQI